MEHQLVIDWDFAASTGRALVAPGPDLKAEAIAGVVGDLREAAVRAEAPIAETTLLRRPADGPVLVVDRASWIAGLCESAKAMFDTTGSPMPGPSAGTRRAKALGLQAGAAFAVFANRILGQFDPFVATPRLLLVAPNVVTVERELGVVPADFRLWVCLHEQTHRFQFGEAPWLRDHLLGLFGVLLDGDELRLGWPAAGTPAGLQDLFANPAQRDAFDRVTAVMSLMEGHADLMMDRVGAGVVPTYGAIRRLFEARRDQQGWGAWLRRLVGLDLKREQYRVGAEFCRRVIDAGGVPTLNVAFSAPEALPTLAEVRQPQRWLQRI